MENRFIINFRKILKKIFNFRYRYKAINQDPVPKHLIIQLHVGILLFSVLLLNQNYAFGKNSYIHLYNPLLITFQKPGSSSDNAGIGRNPLQSIFIINSDLKDDSIKSNNSDTIQPDGFLIENYKLVRVINGVATNVNKDYRLRNGIKILRQGYFVKPGGYIIMINPGEYLDMNGKLRPIDKDDKLLE